MLSRVALLCLCFQLLTPSRAARKKASGTTSRTMESSLPGRTLQKMLNELEESGANISLAVEFTGDVADTLTALTAKFPRAQSASDRSFCQEQGETFGESQLKSAIRETYTRAPFSCVRESQDMADSVFRLFDDRARTTDARKSSNANFVTNCIFQDVVEQYGGSGGRFSHEGFDGWTASNLNKFPGLKTLATQAYTQTNFYGVRTVDVGTKGLFWMFRQGVMTLTAMYPKVTSESDKRYVLEKLKKLFLIFFLPHLLERVDAGLEDEGEAMHLRRGMFYDNVEWAVKFEKMGVALGDAAADPENVKLGEKLLETYGRCFYYQRSEVPPALLLQTSNDLLDRGILMYTMWNYRYVTYFNSQDAQKSLCLQANPSSKWAHAPWTILHAIVALTGPLNFGTADFAQWPTFRLFGLGIVASGMQQDCAGRVSWMPRS